MSHSGKIIVITGPTATGKTALGVEVCRAIGGEVVSADSMQIYRSMDIGTAKVTPEETKGIPHHMVDVVDPWESFSAARWVEMADECCRDIVSRGKTPVIVGGTGLYIDSLISGRSFAQSPGDSGLRQALDDEYLRFGGEALLEKLRKVDPQRAEKLHPMDRKRIVRALEVFELTGKTITQHDEETKLLPPRWDSLRFALSFEDRQSLYDRIDTRVDKMVEKGLYDEVRKLLAMPEVTPQCTSMQAIGYKEAAQYLAGNMTQDEATELIKLGSRRYSKRQLTWLRHDEGLNWRLWGDTPDPENALNEILRKWEEFVKI